MGALSLVGGPGERGVGRAALGEQAVRGGEKGWAAPGRAGGKEVRDGLGHAGAWVGPV